MMANMGGPSWQAFVALEPSDGDLGKGLACRDLKSHLLVKGEAGEPIFLLRSVPRAHPRAPIRLRNIRGEFDRRYALDGEGRRESSASFTTLRCIPEAKGLHPYFVEMMVAIALSLPEVLSETAVDELVEHLIDLFRQGRATAQATVAGLWGELVLIAAAPDPDAWVLAWHDGPTETFDFCFSDKRVEVKTTEAHIREHEFSLTQINSGRDSDFIASVMLRRESAGLTTFELSEKIADLISNRSREKFWRIVFTTFGEDNLGFDESRYDLRDAISSVRFIQSKNIPKVYINDADEHLISHIRFRVNIELVTRVLGKDSI